MLSETKDLHTFREKAITGGINDAFKSKHIESTIPEVQKLLLKVRKNAYDIRIPIMVSTYFEEISLSIGTYLSTNPANTRSFILLVKLPPDLRFDFFSSS